MGGRGGKGGVGPKFKVAQNGLKHILVLEFLKSDEMLNIGKFLQLSTTNQPDGHSSEQLSRSTLYTARLIKRCHVIHLISNYYFFIFKLLCTAFNYHNISPKTFISQTLFDPRTILFISILYVFAPDCMLIRRIFPMIHIVVY